MPFILLSTWPHVRRVPSDDPLIAFSCANHTHSHAPTSLFASQDRPTVVDGPTAAPRPFERTTTATFAAYQASLHNPWICHPASPIPDLSFETFSTYYRALQEAACFFSYRELDLGHTATVAATFRHECLRDRHAIAAGRLVAIDTQVTALDADHASPICTALPSSRALTMGRRQKADRAASATDKSTATALKALQKM